MTTKPTNDTTTNPGTSDPARPADPVAVLREAARYLEQHGWVQDFGLVYHDPHPPSACVIGAMEMVVAGRPVLDEAGQLAPTRQTLRQAAIVSDAVRVLGVDLTGQPPAQVHSQRLSETERLVVNWNDAAGRTVEQVCAALRRAADRFEREVQRSQCCGAVLVETTPSVWLFPGEPLHVERVYGCTMCGRRYHVEVTDPDEADRIFGEVNDPGGDA